MVGTWLSERVVEFGSPPGWSVVHETDSLDLLSTLGDLASFTGIYQTCRRKRITAGTNR